MRKGKKKAANKAKVAAPDAALIRACVRYLQAHAAQVAGFDADPDSDNKVAEAEGDRFFEIEKKVLAIAASTPATTPEGLEAKARIAPTVLGEPHDFLEEPGRAFMVGFFADVRAHLAPVVKEGWLRRRAAARAVEKTEAAA
jgi:hypothetical protein